MITCFDTSAINALHDDPACDMLVKGFLAAGSVRTTAINVLELARTPDKNHRTSLLRLAARLSDGKRPLAHPNTLLRSGITAFARRDASLGVSVDGHEGGIWAALQDPELIDDESVRELDKWHADVEGALKDTQDHRREYEQIFRVSGSGWPRSAAEALRGFLSGVNIYRPVLSDVFERATGRPPRAGELDGLWATLPQWRFYFMAWAYGIYARNMREENYSHRRNAGLIDLTSAGYLGLCSTFITGDVKQYHALRLLSRFGHSPWCRVHLYARLRMALML